MWETAEKILTVSAAWIQAFGSIIALIVAFKVAGRQAKRDDRRRELEQAEWRSSLLMFLLEAKNFLQAAKAINDPESGAAFIDTYDPAYPNRFIAILYKRLESDKIEVRDIAPVLRIIREYKDCTDRIGVEYSRLRAKQFPWDLPEVIRKHADAVANELDSIFQRPPDE